MAKPAGFLVIGYQGYFSRGEGEADHELHLAPKLRISGFIHPLFSCAFLACTGTNLSLPGVKAAGAYGCQPFHLHVPIVFRNSANLNLLEPFGACPDLYRDSFTFTLYLYLLHLPGSTNFSKI